MITRTRDKQTQKGSPQQATKPPTLHVDGLDRQHGPTACLQRTVTQQADIQHTHGGLPARRAAGGVQPTHAHLASAREAAPPLPLRTQRRHAPASRPHARLVAPSRRRLDERLDAVADPLGGR